MVSGLRHGEHHRYEELWTIVGWWCGKLGVLVDWRRAQITTVGCVAYFQPSGWNFDKFLCELGWEYLK
jgi:hypothetical protein